MALNGLRWNKKNILYRTFTKANNHDTFLEGNSPTLTLSRRRPLLYRNQSIDLHSKSMEWFLYNSGLRLERVKFIKYLGRNLEMISKQEVLRTFFSALLVFFIFAEIISNFLVY